MNGLFFRAKRCVGKADSEIDSKQEACENARLFKLLIQQAGNKCLNEIISCKNQENNF